MQLAYAIDENSLVVWLLGIVAVGGDAARLGRLARCLIDTLAHLINVSHYFRAPLCARGD